MYSPILDSQVLLQVRHVNVVVVLLALMGVFLLLSLLCCLLAVLSCSNAWVPTQHSCLQVLQVLRLDVAPL